MNTSVADTFSRNASVRTFAAYLLIFAMGGSLGCDRLTDLLGDDLSEEDPSYPTTYYTLTTSQLGQATETFSQLNNGQICTELNAYGWCSNNWTLCIEIVRQEVFDRAGQISMMKASLVASRQFSVVADSNSLVISKSWARGGCILCDGSEGDITTIGWMIEFENQVYNGLEVLDTRLTVLTDIEKVWHMGGHWYPEVYIPETDQFSPEEAKQSLIGIELQLEGSYTNPSYIIPAGSFIEQVGKFIIPLEAADSVEMRVVWRIGVKYITNENVSDGLATWHVYVDSSTGELVRTEQLVIIN